MPASNIAYTIYQNLLLRTEVAASSADESHFEWYESNAVKMPKLCCCCEGVYVTVKLISDFSDSK